MGGNIDLFDDPAWESVPNAPEVSTNLSFVVGAIASFGVLVAGLMTPWYGIGQAGEPWPDLNPRLSPSSEWLVAPGWRDFLPGYSGLAILVLLAAGAVTVTMALLAMTARSERFGRAAVPIAWIASAISISIVADAFARPTNAVTQPAQTSWGVYLALLLSLIATAAAWSGARGRSVSMGQVLAMER